MMTKPDFLIVGAMKAGTTTLYRDLSAHPDIFLPQDKEPDVLVAGADLEEMRLEYRSLFRAASPGQIKGEASTAYTKRPDHEGVASKARALCGPELKLIYIRRNPVERIVSQYHHERQHGLISEPFPEAIRRHSRLIDYSRYDWQIAPWIEAFDPANVLQLELEDYSAGRRNTLLRVCSFLGVDPTRMGSFDEQASYNRAEEQKAVHNPLLRALILSRAYQRVLKNLFPRTLRDRIRNWLLPPAPPEEVDAGPEEISYILAKLGEPRL